MAQPLGEPSGSRAVSARLLDAAPGTVEWPDVGAWAALGRTPQLWLTVLWTCSVIRRAARAIVLLRERESQRPVGTASSPVGSRETCIHGERQTVLSDHLWGAPCGPALS